MLVSRIDKGVLFAIPQEGDLPVLDVKRKPFQIVRTIANGSRTSPAICGTPGVLRQKQVSRRTVLAASSLSFIPVAALRKLIVDERRSWSFEDGSYHAGGCERVAKQTHPLEQLHFRREMATCLNTLRELKYALHLDQ